MSAACHRGLDPEVSVLMPFRNAESTLSRCLESIRVQSMPRYELLAVDDASDDGGPSMLSTLAARDPRIRLLKTPTRGLVHALNRGLEAATAPLVARMDADDWMHPDRLAAQLGFMRANPELAVVASRVRAFPAKHVTGGMREYLRWQDGCLSPQRIRDDIYVESPFVHPSVMFRRDIIVASGGYRCGGFPEDYELWLRLTRSGHGLAKLPDRLLAWRLSPSSASRSDPRYSREAFDELRSRYLFTDRRLEGRAVAVWGAGRRTRKRAARVLAMGLRPIAWVDIDPRKIGNRLEGVPVVAPRWLRDRTERPFVLVYVASHGARDAIARELEPMGYRRGSDFLLVG